MAWQRVAVLCVVLGIVSIAVSGAPGYVANEARSQGLISSVVAAASIIGAIAGLAGLWLFTSRSPSDEIRRLLEELSERATAEGAAAAETDALAVAATVGTIDLLREAIALQDASREREAIDVLLEAFRRDLTPEARAQLHSLIGNSFLNLSELGAAEGHYRQARDAAAEADDRDAEATSLGNLGIVCQQQGDLARAEELHLGAMSLYREIGNRSGEAHELNNLGTVCGRRNDLDRAEEYLLRALAIDREIGYRMGEGTVLGNLGTVYANNGNFVQAEQRYREGLAIHREIGHRVGEANLLLNLGTLYAPKGDADRAAQHFREALTIHREIGHRLGEAQTLSNLGLVAIQRDERTEGCQLFRDALAIFEEVGAMPQVSLMNTSLEELGCEDEPADD